MKKIAVIGAGLGGLAAAARLAYAGYKVDVFERNPVSGGKAGRVELGDFRFDTGPSIVTLVDVICELYRDVGEDMDRFLHFFRPEESCRYFFPDGTVIRAVNDPERLSGELEEKTGVPAVRVRHYLQSVRRMYEASADIFLNAYPWQWNAVRWIRQIPKMIRLHPADFFSTMHDTHQKTFGEERLVQLFDRYATYNGSSPYLTPGLLNMIAHVEHGLGVFVPEGGMSRIAEELSALARRKGAVFHFGSEVQGILIRRGRAFGVRLPGGERECDAVISNVDVMTTRQSLLRGLRPRSRSGRSPELSMSAVIFLWGIKGEHSRAGIHNVLFSRDYRQEFEDIFARKECPDDPTVYVCITSKYHRADAPQGCENWFVMVNVPADCSRDWTVDAAQLKKAVMNTVREAWGIDVAGAIMTERILTPVDLRERSGSFEGCLYGRASHSRRDAFFRPANRSGRTAGLYYCGGSVHPGGGIPLVLRSGKLAAQAAMEDFR